MVTEKIDKVYSGDLIIESDNFPESTIYPGRNELWIAVGDCSRIRWIQLDLSPLSAKLFLSFSQGGSRF